MTHYQIARYSHVSRFILTLDHMNRKDFLTKLAVTTVAIQSLTSLSSCNGDKPSVKEDEGLVLPDKITAGDIAAISDTLNQRFKTLLSELGNLGWLEWLEAKTKTNVFTGITPDNRDHEKFTEVIKDLSLTTKGFDDFAGKRFIEPGYPAMSLLYHALASPRVEPEGFAEDKYPSLAQLDILEDYIYALKKVTEEEKKEYVLAVFAYEYRPAFKTPHQVHADIVFSRTGVARIGDRAMSYNKKARCYTNLPSLDSVTNADIEKKKTAVTPSRYGLFLAKVTKVENRDMILMGGKVEEDEARYFLQPIRKVFNDDLFINNRPVNFTEYHKAEKLYRLAVDKRIKLPEYLFDVNKPPFIRATGDANALVALTGIGSSALLSSVPGDLVRPAFQKKDDLLRPNVMKENVRLHFEVPMGNNENRYYSSFSLIDSLRYMDVYLLGSKKGDASSSTNEKHRPFEYEGPKNSPQFVNMRYVDTANSGKYDVHMGPDMDNFEYSVLTSHWAGLFEDSICDGCVSALIAPTEGNTNTMECLPAFSLVTAPDFFPLVDSFDLLKYDIGLEQSVNSHFYEGGTASLCTLRKRANPTTIVPQTKQIAFPYTGAINPHDKRSMVHDTITAVSSGKVNRRSKITAKFTDPKLKEYTSNSYLPDASSSVFNPGWDTTYSNDTASALGDNIFLTTRGLGSPFPEDMKLCAAANGMWPVASPDIARSFQGSSSVEDVDGIHGVEGKEDVEGRYSANPTSIPLLDIELGFHRDSPAL